MKFLKCKVSIIQYKEKIMRKIVLLLVTLLLGLTAFLPTGAVYADGGRRGAGEIVVANRVSGSISVIDVRTNQLVTTVDLPEGDNVPEPM
jgi:YVTN family beta-propeller protein